MLHIIVHVHGALMIGRLTHLLPKILVEGLLLLDAGTLPHTFFATLLPKVKLRQVTCKAITSIQS